MNKNGKIALGVVGGLLVIGGVTRLVSGDGGAPDPKNAAQTTTAAVTTTTAATTTTTAATTTPSATTTTEKQLTVYLLNPDSMKIHYENCSTIEHPENFIKTVDYKKAIDDGYTPCGRCDPVDLNKYE